MAESLNTEYKSDTFFFYALSYFDQVFIICSKTIIPLLPINHNAVWMCWFLVGIVVFQNVFITFDYEFIYTYVYLRESIHGNMPDYSVLRALGSSNPARQMCDASKSQQIQIVSMPYL